MVERCKQEMKKLYKTIELNRVTLSQYENVIKQQQYHMDQFNKRSVGIPWEIITKSFVFLFRNRINI